MEDATEIEQMNDPKQPKSGQSPLVRTCYIVFTIIGVITYEAIAPSLFGNAAQGGFNFTKFLGAGVVGGVCGGIGYGVGKLLERIRG